MQNRNKRLLFDILFALCLAVLALRIADLALFTDPETGFVSWGSFALRCVIPVAVAAAAYFAAPRVSVRPAPLMGPVPALGGLMIGTAAALFAAALLAAGPLVKAFKAGGGAQAVVGLFELLLPLLGAEWFFVFGLLAFRPRSTQKPPSAVSTPAAILWIFWLMVYRFAGAPASVQRLGSTLRVFSAAAGLLCAAALFRVFLTPGGAYGRALFPAGIAAFLFCTCHELPQAVFEALYGRITAYDFCISLALGVLGLCGLVCARACVGESLPEPPKPQEESEAPKAKNGK